MRIIEVFNFVTDSEAEVLDQAGVQTTEDHQIRVCPDDNEALVAVGERVVSLIQKEFGDSVYLLDNQIVTYTGTGEYVYHMDPPEDGSFPRDYTGLIYLNDDFDDGGTHFRDQDVTVVPAKGKIALWANVEGSIHKGMPVSNGTKKVINFWMARSQT
jgi:hypothetical protein